VTWAQAFNDNIGKVLGLITVCALATFTSLTWEQMYFTFERAVFMFLSKYKCS